MLYKFKVSLLLLLLVSASTMAQQSRNAQFVNPFIGTGGSGHTFPGATTPLGFVQVSPETGNGKWEYCAGYQYGDSLISGFSHTHLSGTGVADLGDLLLQPFTGNVKKANYSSRFSHDQERASAGYYSVFLKDYQVNAELTCTQRAAFHQYKFNQSSGHLLVDVQHGLVNNMADLEKHVVRSEIKVKDNKTLTGYRITNSWGGERHVYFVIKFDQPFNTFHWLSDSLSNRNQRIVVDFKNDDKLIIKAKVGISTVSVENALANLSAEISDWNFDGIRKTAFENWNTRLSKIDIQGTLKQKQTFYTALYHTLIAPNNIADVNGQYRGADNKVYTSKDKSYFSTLSLWDTYRALNPLYTIIYPDNTNKIINSMLAHYDVAGFLPIWSLWGHENFCMIANHAIPVIVDAYRKGIRNYDIEKAYAAIKNSSTQSHKNSNWETYMRYGYLPNDLIRVESASTTLESAYDDWCVAQMAKSLGKKDDYALFSKRAGFYKNLFDPSSGLMRGKRSDGQWATPFDPLKISHAFSSGGDYTEGNAWQYSWHVQQDIPGLMNLMGGRVAFIKKLDTLFSMDSKVYGDGGTSDVTGLIGQYVQGNEPSHHVAYLYAIAGQSWKTQEKINTITNTLYSNTPEGLSGNDDCGQMSAWYVFSAMGFYPVNPASAEYVLGAPQLPSAIIKVGNNKRFVIKALNFSDRNKYVQSVSLNGKPFTKTSISHHELMRGGVMEFTMGNKPNN
ncbi:MAG: glycoside hydrolase family 92 protein [Pedobacter sp.]|nr:MAG: glycoside hydrolase family 92 protein [Pedobacter sp.]